MPAPHLLSPRAKQIAEGLVRTGRASDARLFRTWLQLRATAGNFYWIAMNGSALLRGDTFDGAEELQPSFADAHGARWGDAMIREGRDYRLAGCSAGASAIHSPWAPSS
jgi:hypothetical protein